jgi:acyl-CoA reductase-like NAD-dependent aldehyde dehydrogenase
LTRIDPAWFPSDPYPQLIAGAARRDGARHDVVDPSTGDVHAQWAEATPDEVDAALGAARRSFDTGEWRRMAPSRRAEVLDAVAQRIRDDADRLAALEAADTGKAVGGAKTYDVHEAAVAFAFAAGVGRDLHGDVRRTAFPPQLLPGGGPDVLTMRLREPAGVVVELLPWNGPLMTGSQRIAAALAAGCSIVVKPPEEAVVSTIELARILDECGLPPGTVNVVLGPGETVGEQLVADTRVDLVSLTGGVETGARVMATAARNITPVHLELGGKSPVIVFADADLDRALDAAIFGVFTLNGERCTAGSRLLLEDSIYDEFVAKLLARVARIKVGDPHDMTTEVGPLIHRDHLAKVRGYLDIARQEGARIAVGGDAPGDPALAHGNYLRPTVLLDVTNDMRVAQEEIFGPVLAVLRFRDEAEALRIANGTRYGLAAYLWTGDVTRAHRFAPEIESGMIWVNSQNVRHLPTPFGGMKWSGIGREGGHYSFEFYCETKNVCIAIGDTPIPRLGA